MGIRYEKDTILDWVNEMGKFLRLLVDGYNAFDEPVADSVVEEGYMRFFKKDRHWMHNLSEEELLVYVNEDLEEGQIRSLALLLLQDGKYSNITGEKRKNLFRKAKLLLNHASDRLGQFSFEDYGIISDIDNELLK